LRGVGGSGVTAHGHRAPAQVVLHGQRDRRRTGAAGVRAPGLGAAFGASGGAR
jgi:hypothetical protein